jgi:predicted GNAT family acetyltransferase
MIESILKNKYGSSLSALDIYENDGSLILSRIVIDDKYRGSGIGTKVMNDLIEYADNNTQIIALTPSSDFGGNKNRLIQFYKKFGFKANKGHHKSFEFRDSMIRYPKLNENMKPLIKKLLRENLDRTITCKKCGNQWKESETTPEELYVCHKCHPENLPKGKLNEMLMTQDETDVKSVSDFINFAKKYLGIDDDIKVALAYERTPDLTTTAFYDLNGFVKIYVKNRAIIDVCRSIAHELVHHKQNLEGRLVDAMKDGSDGSPIENEANAVAGKIVRRYGKLKPEIYI